MIRSGRYNKLAVRSYGPVSTAKTEHFRASSAVPTKSAGRSGPSGASHATPGPGAAPPAGGNPLHETFRLWPRLDRR